jgi:hypothetical protein
MLTPRSRAERLNERLTVDQSKRRGKLNETEKALSLERREGAKKDEQVFFAPSRLSSEFLRPSRRKSSL